MNTTQLWVLHAHKKQVLKLFEQHNITVDKLPSTRYITHINTFANDEELIKQQLSKACIPFTLLHYEHGAPTYIISERYSEMGDKQCHLQHIDPIIKAMFESFWDGNNLQFNLRKQVFAPWDNQEEYSAVARMKEVLQ